MPLRGPALGALVAALLAVAPAAQAASDIVFASGGGGGPRLVILGAHDEENQMTVTFDGVTAHLVDATANLNVSGAASFYCSVVDAHTVDCSASGFDGTQGIGLQLGDGTPTDVAPNSATVSWNASCGVSSPCVDYTGSNGVDTFNGSEGVDNVFTDEGNDVIDGRGGNDILRAGDGDDTVIGSGGSDQLFGGSGNDTLRADDGAVDAVINCFGEVSGTDGTADAAYVDGNDPASENCETVNGAPTGGGGGGGGGGGTTTNPGTTTTPGTGTTPTGPAPTTQAAPARIYLMPDLEPVKRSKAKTGTGKSLKYTYTKISAIEKSLFEKGICTTLTRNCPAGNLHVVLDLKGGQKVPSAYAGDVPDNAIVKETPKPDAKLSEGQRLTFQFADPTLDNDKECDIRDGADDLHYKVADLTFEQTVKYMTDRDCKEGRDWKVTKRTTVTTLAKTSLIHDVTRTKKNGDYFYGFDVWDRKSVPPCTFANSTEQFVLDTFRVQQVKSATEALALLAREDCPALVVKTLTTPTATDPVVAAVKKTEIKSPYGDSVEFGLTINQYVPQRAPGEPPRAGDPVLPKSDFCASSVTFGPLSFKGACLKREGFTWVSTGQVDVNGLKIVPSGANAKVVLDPLNLRVAVSGEASVVLDAKFGSRRVGPVTLYKGRFDWVFQYKPDLAGIAGVIMPPAGNAGPGLSLGAIQKLPGLGGSLPNLGGLKIPDFSGLSRDQLDALATKVPKIDFPNVEIPSSVIPDFALPEIGFSVPQGVGDFLGFPLTGEVKAKLETRGGVRGAAVSANLALPAVFGGVAGSAKFFVGSDGTLQADAIGLQASELWVGPTKLAPVAISYDGPSDTWKGGTKVFLYPGAPGIGGSFLVSKGQLQQVGINLEGEVPLGPIFLNRFDGVITFAPSFAVTGTLGGSAGPSIPGFGPIVGLSTTFAFNQDVFRIEGDVKVANVPLGNALVEYYTNGQFHAKGELSYFIDSAKEYGFGGGVEGWASSRGFNVTGNVAFRAKSLKLEGKGIVSSVGVAGCATIQGPLWSRADLGAGYRWGDTNIQWIGGACDLGPYTAAVRRSALRQAGTNAISFPAGLDVASVAVQGSGAPPRVTITGPKGETVTTPAGNESLQDDRFIVIQQPADATTYVAIAKPTAGKWTITTEAGSAPVTKILSADALPDPKVTAKVTGSGAKRRLAYTVKTMPGQVVRFAEEGDGVAQDLGVAKGAKGSLTFAPASGAAIARSVYAIVEQGGLVRDKLLVARYRAPGGELAAPKVHAKRKGSSVAVSWSAVGGAKGYRVTSTFNGRTVFATVTGRKTTVAGLLPTSGASVVVQAIGGADGLGRGGKAGVKAPKPRKRGR